MSHAVWKFAVPLLHKPDRPVIEMPNSARILTLQTQLGHPHIWAEVDTDAPLVRRRFQIVGTGHALPERPRAYVGTWQSGEFVFHLYEINPTTGSS